MTRQHLTEESASNRAIDLEIPEELQGSLAALKRAALNAQKLAEHTETDLIMIRSGKLVRVSPRQTARPG